MTVGDIIKATELSTGNTYEARIISGSPSAGLYSDDHGNYWQKDIRSGVRYNAQFKQETLQWTKPTKPEKS